MGFRRGKSETESQDAVPLDDGEPADIGEGLSAEIRELARQKLRHTIGVRRELKAVHELLAEGEMVLNLAAGGYDGRQGLLVVTERRLFFFEKGMARSRQEDFPYSKVSSIQTETKMTSGSLVIFVSGNKAVIKQVMPKERVAEIGEYVRSRISDGPPRVDAPAGPTGAPERLRSLQAMLDQGLISPDEFESKRREILDSV